jgi:uracil-DNA glycosylase
MKSTKHMSNILDIAHTVCTFLCTYNCMQLEDGLTGAEINSCDWVHSNDRALFNVSILVTVGKPNR